MWHGSLLYKCVASSLLSSPAELPGLLASCWALNQCDMPDSTQSSPCIWERTAKHSHSCPISGGIKVGKGLDDVGNCWALSTPGNRGLVFGVELGLRRGPMLPPERLNAYVSIRFCLICGGKPLVAAGVRVGP